MDFDKEYKIHNLGLSSKVRSKVKDIDATIEEIQGEIDLDTFKENVEYVAKSIFKDSNDVNLKEPSLSTKERMEISIKSSKLGSAVKRLSVHIINKSFLDDWIEHDDIIEKEKDPNTGRMSQEFMRDFYSLMNSGTKYLVYVIPYIGDELVPFDYTGDELKALCSSKHLVFLTTKYGKIRKIAVGLEATIHNLFLVTKMAANLLERSEKSILKESNLGLNNKVKKKFDKVDAIDNISQIQFEDPEVERICHEHGVYTVDDAAKVTSIIIDEDKALDVKKTSWFSENSSIKTFNEFKYFTGLKTIKGYAFTWCTSLKCITIPSSVTEIGCNAFYNCKDLQSINIPDSVISIGKYAFYSCESLQSVTIPDGVTSIGQAFCGCKSLQSVTIPDGVTSIEYESFYKCTSLQSVSIPNSVTSIKNRAFIYCTALQSINIPDSVTSIGDCALYGCESLHTIYISRRHPLLRNLRNKTYTNHCKFIDPNEVNESNLGLSKKVQKKHNDMDAFEQLYDVKTFDGIIYTMKSFLDQFGYKEVEDVYMGYSPLVYDIIDYSNPENGTRPSVTFAVGLGKTKMKVGDHMPTIWQFYFAESSGKMYMAITYDTKVKPVDVIGPQDHVLGWEVTLDRLIKLIKFCSTYDDENQKIINENELGLNNKVKNKFNKVNAIDNVSQIQFEDPEVERICHEHDVYTIGDAAKVTSIKTPDPEMTSGKSWFMYASIKSFNEFKYFIGVEDFKHIFFGCSALETITLPDSATSIGDYAFYGCTTLQSIRIPDSVTSIGYYAFSHCYSLQSINIPDSVTSIEIGMFENCISLKSINIPDSVISIKRSSFYRCESLQSVNIPDSVISIEAWSFGWCTSLQSVNIPDSVISIEKYAFYSCKSLQSVNIPDSVTSIGNDVFLDSDSLKTIYISKNYPLRKKLQKEYPNIKLDDFRGMNESELGLNKKIQKKYDKKDSIESLEDYREIVKSLVKAYSKATYSDLIETLDFIVKAIGKKYNIKNSDNATPGVWVSTSLSSKKKRMNCILGDYGGYTDIENDDEYTALRSSVLMNKYIAHYPSRITKSLKFVDHIIDEFSGFLYQVAVNYYNQIFEFLSDIKDEVKEYNYEKTKKLITSLNETNISLGLNKKVKDNFSNKNVVDNIESPLRRGDFIKLISKKFSEIKGVKYINCDFNSDTSYFIENKIKDILIYLDDSLSYEHRTTTKNGYNLGVSSPIHLRILEKDGEDTFRIFASRHFGDLSSKNVDFGLGESPWNVSLSDDPKCFYSLTEKNIEKAANWLDSYLKEVYGDELNESISNLGLNKKIQKKFNNTNSIEKFQEDKKEIVEHEGEFIKMFLEEALERGILPSTDEYLKGNLCGADKMLDDFLSLRLYSPRDRQNNTGWDVNDLITVIGHIISYYPRREYDSFGIACIVGRGYISPSNNFFTVRVIFNSTQTRIKEIWFGKISNTKYVNSRGYGPLHPLDLKKLTKIADIDEYGNLLLTRTNAILLVELFRSYFRHKDDLIKVKYKYRNYYDKIEYQIKEIPLRDRLYRLDTIRSNNAFCDLIMRHCWKKDFK